MPKLKSNQIKTSSQVLLQEFMGISEKEPKSDFDAFCEAHPEEASELRLLYALKADSEKGFKFFGGHFGEHEPAETDDQIRVGDSIGDFRLIRHIASGGQGEVWEAEQSSMQRRVALKLVLPGAINEKTLSLFSREARAGGRLSHPGIITIYGFGENNDRHWIAQELIEGSWTLRDFIDERRQQAELSPNYHSACAKFLIALSDALQAAHDAGIIHRDVKPQNILVTQDNRPKLTDFGLARITDEVAMSVTGDFCGTWLYMSPEQVTAKRIDIDHRTDIFSLGVVMYEMLSFIRPFDGDTTHQIAETIIYVDPPALNDIRSRIPKELSIICAKALEKRKAARFSSMAEFNADLSRWLNHEPIHAKPPTPLERSAKWCKRNPTKSVAISLVLAALVFISILLAANLKSKKALKESLNDLNEERIALAATNDDLNLQRQLSERKTRELDESNRELKRQTALALAQERIADSRSDKILTLSSTAIIEALRRESESLWPAHPEMLEAYRVWLEHVSHLKAGKLLGVEDGPRPNPDATERLRKHSLLEQKSIQETNVTVLERLKQSADYPALVRLRAESDWYRKMLGLTPWSDTDEVSPELPSEYSNMNGAELNSAAWAFVDPSAPAFGQESIALLIAHTAVELAQDELHIWALDTLAWANYRTGLFTEALEICEIIELRDAGPGFAKSIADLRIAMQSWEGDSILDRNLELELLKRNTISLEVAIGVRRFSSPADRQGFDQSLALIEGIEALCDPEVGLASDCMQEEFGWGISKRLKFAESIERNSISGPRAKQRWQEAQSSFANSPHYSATILIPQMGLIPIGADPNSGLLEFSHLQTGEIAERDQDGTLHLAESMGLVFVLIPAGEFFMGAQNSDRDAPNFDPYVRPGEGPVHEVSLPAYFISKYEMTQAQWIRIAGYNRSYYRPPSEFAPSLLHPVEQVSWSECSIIMNRLGLSLPTEQQWERAARGNTTTTWWTGQSRDSLWGMINIADRSALEAGADYQDAQYWPEFNDGAVIHSEVGSFPPNPFGLHEVGGNILEWCADSYGQNSYDDMNWPSVSTEAIDRPTKVLRGGDYYQEVSFTRSASRSSTGPESEHHFIGLRPARALTH
jgi:serine/threonine protein kinase/formylglycine-generating enzyme required for sulfatase activity